MDSGPAIDTASERGPVTISDDSHHAAKRVETRRTRKAVPSREFRNGKHWIQSHDKICRVQGSNDNGGRAARTSTQLSSFISRPSSLGLEPLIATLLLGGASSSVLLTAGRFLSSILGFVVDGRREAEVVVAAGIRRGVARDAKSGSTGSQQRALVPARPLSPVSSQIQVRGRS